MSNNTICTRLLPGEDVYDKITQICISNELKAGFVVCAVGSLKHLKMRLADSITIIDLEANYELLNMSGTVSEHGLHLHITVADAQGNVLGGHLLPGCQVKTTMELIINRVAGVIFEREYDQTTGYRELVIK